jgi:hypothetical protein
MGRYDSLNVSTLLGKTLKSVTADDGMVFTTTDNEVYRLEHYQVCCESVYIEDIVGDLTDLVGSPLLMSEEVSSDGTPPLNESDVEYGVYHWTFYKFATIKGYVTVRFYGTSNGYYSTSVDFYQDDQDDQE